MKARDIMSSPVVAVTPEVPIRVAAGLLASHGFTALPVVDGDERLIAIVTEADLLRGCYGDGESVEALVREVMTTPVYGMDPEAPVELLARVMVDDRVRCVPVVDASRLVGVVTRRDLVRALAGADVPVAADVRRRLDAWVARDRRPVDAVGGASTGQPVVVGVDGSAAALAAAEWAAAEAARHDVPVELVHAYPLPVRGYPEIALTGNRIRQASAELGRERLDAAERAVRAVAPEVEVSTSLLVGSPAAVLVAASGRARLVVLGSRGPGGFPGLVGSVAVAVSAHGTSPVVVVRRSAPVDGPVVVGVDGSPVSEAAVAFAFEQACLRGVPLIALTAWSDFFAGSRHASRFAAAGARVEAEEHRALAERLAGWQEKYPDVAVSRVVVRDQPVHALLEAGRDACLLVVGSHGRGGFTGMLLGSTGQALVHHAPCPLAIVRPRGGAVAKGPRRPVRPGAGHAG
ncbi:universal stress protein [Saccharothrix algeriensis]|uniref:Nucleotide-binding universal stress UspA family protein/CBS domain-containing protein n=1 Tax=Saccharothrix algeriensis TaxID=173560 RepID=A0A8T8I004_9PSEU|nr:universal stress protein [Saccharothrix algeriensis]MBM7809716.1 nucleotide-binding universal stress UspA family protein/CBS domain-containing protein [Saccharothrix algeriensis]QTR04008.1 universal stress protein [Saccharothrix algeriensis]